MFKFSFKIKHKDCEETGLSEAFPGQHITVIDIQSKNPKEKQYFYHITGNNHEFDSIIEYLNKSKSYKLTEEVERSKDTLLLLVVLHQSGYVQNTIQKHNGFFLEPHTVHGGFEYWHVGVVKHESIDPMRKDLEKAGDLTVLYIGEVDFAHSLLSKQQKKVFTEAYGRGYYEIPRKTSIAKIAKSLRISPSTVGEHLMRAENKVINSATKSFKPDISG